jgi:hypothetical protein
MPVLGEAASIRRLFRLVAVVAGAAGSSMQICWRFVRGHC